MRITFNTGVGQTIIYNPINNTVEYITINNGTMVKVTACGCDKGETQ